MKGAAKLKLHEFKRFEFHLLACGGANLLHSCYMG